MSDNLQTRNGLDFAVADLTLHVTISLAIVTALPLCLWAGLLHDSETSRPPAQGWTDREGADA